MAEAPIKKRASIKNRARNKARGRVSAFPDRAWIRSLQKGLLQWYAQNARKLPWRGTHDPYRVWVSEIMLQQTQVETVKSYFARFIQNFPNIAALANSSEESVLRLWEGLGYYRRARQLHRAARHVVAAHNGVFPTEPEAVRKLPGVGRYTAGAILSIALDARQPILEANTTRLFSRLLALRGDVQSSAAQKTLWHFATEILPRENVGEFNQALMELGSLICVPRGPKCELCPLKKICPTRRLNLQQTIPSAKKRPPVESVQETAFIVERRGKIILRQCGPNERWAGLWDFPRFACDPAEVGTAEKQLKTMTGLRIGVGNIFATLKHGVTRYRIVLTCRYASAGSGPLRRDENSLRWVTRAESAEYPLNVTARKIVRLLMAGTEHDEGS